MDEPKVLTLSDLPGASPTSASASFEEFFEVQRDRLFGVLALMTGDRSEAEEIAQDALVAIWERWDRVQLMDNPEGYLYRTAINTFRKRYGRAKLLRPLVPSSIRSSSAPADASVILGDSLRALTPRQRAALVLTELLGYSAEEAARALGVKASTIGALKYQGRTALRQEAENDDD